jgi:hypothetical protein
MKKTNSAVRDKFAVSTTRKICRGLRNDKEGEARKVKPEEQQGGSAK